MKIDGPTQALSTLLYRAKNVATQLFIRAMDIPTEAIWKPAAPAMPRCEPLISTSANGMSVIMENIVINKLALK